MENLKIEEQFKEVYESEADSLFRYTLMRVSSHEQALDIVQDVFIKLWQAYQKGEEIKNNRAFLYAILKNQIIDWYRKKKSLSLDAMIERKNSDGTLPYDPADDNAHEQIIFSHDAKLLIESIKGLPQKYRDAVHMRLVEDFTPEEIAVILKIRVNTVSVHINRGMEKLRKNLK